MHLYIEDKLIKQMAGRPKPEQLLCWWISALANNRDGVQATSDRLAYYCGMSRASFFRAIRNLERDDVVEVVSTTGRSRYEGNIYKIK